ncbi:1-acyl-sn-glycerol-3-phosphate acyltransferase [Imbroritus primus]|uniref:1-acyl-sn-glycerol-3-phosphate acyltransferase n=1 Tax=Imbroritus primus TaxID=3058603 RepID=A0ACD3SJY3_9BURK|nr:1-acyl-sn-glycerol-3-phosphate acyltransferase [Burkholderiaceae bacterium PBA]
MIVLRSTLFLLYLIVATPPYAIACMLSFPLLGAHKRFTMVVGWTRMTVYMAKVLCGIRYTFKHRERLDQARDLPVILLSKHQSAWETIFFVATMPRPLCYVFKRELIFVPFFGWTLGLLKMIHINRRDGTNAFQSVVRQGRERLADGSWIIIFPEGTRTRPGAPNPRYKSGGARLAVETGAWVIPIAHNSGHVWPRNSFLKYPGEITVSIGEPMDVTGQTPDQVNTAVRNWIEDEMRVIDAPRYRDAQAASQETGR